MTLEEFMPELNERCSKCGEVIEGAPRFIHEKGKPRKPYCRKCFGKRLGRKEDETK